MARFHVSVHVEASPARVWEILCDWEGSAAWMVDATTVEIVGTRREGPGTHVKAVTTIAGAPLTDEMVVTAWDPPHTIEVMHVGWPIKGPAWFSIAPEGDGTRFEWGEELEAPLGPLGELGGRVLRRPIERVLRASALKLKALAES
jgi:carbon monoxide dehydrogenase subunit G